MLCILTSQCCDCTMAADIKMLILKGEDVNLVDQIIVGDLNFTKDNISTIYSKITIQDSKILGSMDFRRLIFKKSINFENTTFLKKPSFSSVRFMDSVSFSNSKFELGALFQNGKFEKDLRLDWATFNNSPDFSGVQFGKNASFIGTNFNTKPTFEGASFNGNSSFNSAHFLRGANFLSAKFSRNAFFNDAFFGDEFTLRGSDFNGTISFEGSKINDVAYLSDIRLAGNLNISNMRFHKLYFQNIVFADSARVFLDRSEFDTLIVDWDILKSYLNYDRDIYSALIDNFKKQGNFNAADDCYYQLRKLDKNNANIFWDWAYGYGVKPLRALTWCFIIIFLAAIVYMIYYKLATKGGKFEFMEALILSASVFILIHSIEKRDPRKLKFLFLLEAFSGCFF